MQRATKPSFVSRVLASLVDYLVILGWMLGFAVITTLLWLVTGEIYNWLQLGPAGAQLLGFLVLVLPVGIYLYLSETSVAAATLGKRRMHLRVVNRRTGEQASKVQILQRTVIKLLPWEISHLSFWNFVAIAATGSTEFRFWLYAVAIFAELLPLLYLLLVAVNSVGLAPHDLLAGIKVIRLQPAP